MSPASPSTGILDVEQAKADMRSRARARRLERSERQRATAADALAAQALADARISGASCVSVYASRPSEPGTLPLIVALADAGVRVLLPLLGDGLQRGWGDFLGADDLTSRAPGRPPEPSSPFLPQSEVAAADVIIAPALAVDPSGTRLGQGGGWYDRALVDARADALILAYCFADEVHVEGTVPREAHDLPVHGVVTPDALTSFGR